MPPNTTLQQPTDIARETLLRLAQRRIAPTPDNYAEAYGEIAGGQDFSGAAAVRMLENFADELTGSDAAQAPQGRALRVAIAERNWDEARAILAQLNETSGRDPDWASLLRALLRQWGLRHTGLTTARKRATVRHLTTVYAGDSAKLHERLSSVVKSWAETPSSSAKLADEAPLAEDAAASGIDVAPVQADAPRSGALAKRAVAAGAPSREVLELVADTIERAVARRLTHAPRLAAEAGEIIDAARRATDANDVERLSLALKNFWFRMEASGAGPDRVIERLGALLRLMVENLGELVADEAWVSGQVEHMRGVLDGPIDEHNLREAERSFRRLLYRQASVKYSLDQAKQALKQALSTFVERLGGMVTNTGAVRLRMNTYAQELAGTEDVQRINEIVRRITSEAGTLQTDLQRDHDELQRMRQTASEHEARVRALETELESISQLVREDGLTHALNRRGLAEAFVVEVMRSERNNAPMCLAILDVDDFKALNDRYGHAAGDEALVHLTSVLRAALRPYDVLTRYGGEEFVILLPETDIADAAAVLRRTQRELTRHFFMHDNERLLITFSVGVAERRPGEEQAAIIDRADAALYLAKRQGKNRVVQAEVPVVIPPGRA